MPYSRDQPAPPQSGLLFRLLRAGGWFALAVGAVSLLFVTIPGIGRHIHWVDSWRAGGPQFVRIDPRLLGEGNLRERHDLYVANMRRYRITDLMPFSTFADMPEKVQILEGRRGPTEDELAAMSAFELEEARSAMSWRFYAKLFGFVFSLNFVSLLASVALLIVAPAALWKAWRGSKSPAGWPA